MEVLRDSEARIRFAAFCKNRILQECALRDLPYEPWNLRITQTTRDPEGPGVTMQPVLLEYVISEAQAIEAQTLMQYTRTKAGIPPLQYPTD